MPKTIRNFKKKEMLLDLKTIATGSDGNCYILKSPNGRAIILDCGISFEEITHNENFPKFSDIDFVFVSHRHSDHSKALKDFKFSGCEIVSYETLEPKMQKWDIGDWECITFPVAHNVPNWGIIIRSKETGEKLCYVTDFTSMPKIEGINYFLYEVNYIESLIEEFIDAGVELKHYGFVNHNSLEKTIEYFESLNTKPEKIFCCHLSSHHSERKTIKEQMIGLADEIIIL